MKRVYWSRIDGRRLGVVFIVRAGDMAYLDLYLWKWTALIQLWRTK